MFHRVSHIKMTRVRLEWKKSFNFVFCYCWFDMPIKMTAICILKTKANCSNIYRRCYVAVVFVVVAYEFQDRNQRGNQTNTRMLTHFSQNVYIILMFFIQILVFFSFFIVKSAVCPNSNTSAKLFFFCIRYVARNRFFVLMR